MCSTAHGLNCGSVTNMKHCGKRSGGNSCLVSSSLLQLEKITEAKCYVFESPLPDDKILDWSKLKQIADDILQCI